MIMLDTPFIERNRWLVRHWCGSNPVAALAGVGMGLPLIRTSPSRDRIWATCRSWWLLFLSSTCTVLGLRCLFKGTAAFVQVLELMLGQGEDAQVQGRANLLGSFLEDHNLLDHDFAAVLAQVE
jgi:hypothetical protein